MRPILIAALILGGLAGLALTRTGPSALARAEATGTGDELRLYRSGAPRMMPREIVEAARRGDFIVVREDEDGTARVIAPRPRGAPPSPRTAPPAGPPPPSP